VLYNEFAPFALSGGLDQYQLNLPDPATPIMFGIHSLHNHILFFISVIFIVVCFLLFSILYYFSFYRDEFYTSSYYYNRIMAILLKIVGFIFFFINLFVAAIDSMFRIFEEHNVLSVYWTASHDLIVYISKLCTQFVIISMLIFIKIWQSVGRYFSTLIIAFISSLNICLLFIGTQFKLFSLPLKYIGLKPLVDKDINLNTKYSFLYIINQLREGLNFYRTFWARNFAGHFNYGVFYRILLEDDFIKTTLFSPDHIENIDSNKITWLTYLLKNRQYRVTHNLQLEVIWTIIPTIILIIIAVPSFALLYSMDELLEPTVTVKVIGHQWYWSYEYSDFKPLLNETIKFDSYMIPDTELKLGDLRLLKTDCPLILPKETNIRFLITATDVLHSWSVPSFGIKMDAVPGRLNQTSAYIMEGGRFYGQCSELCGVNHGFMPTEICVVEPIDYYNWVYLKI
jgi:cytochrome c oxidase subunit 2